MCPVCLFSMREIFPCQTDSTARLMAKIVKIEGHFEDLGKRFLSEAQLEADPELAAEGWERRFTTDTKRADEVIQLYSQLGYEVRAEPVKSEETTECCQDCHSSNGLTLKTIYTRLKRS